MSNVSKPTILVVEPLKILYCFIKQTLRKIYPQYEIHIVGDVDSAMYLIEHYQDLQWDFNLVLLDLDLPKNPGSPAHVYNGIKLIEALMQQANPNLHIAVATQKFKYLVRIKKLIGSYGGGFVVSDKFSTGQDLLNVVEPALNGLQRLPPEVQSFRRSNGTEADFADIKPIWIDMLEKHEQAYTNNAIASQLDISDRTLRTYWDDLAYFVDVHKPEKPSVHQDQEDSKNKKDKKDEKDFKAQIIIKAKEIGLIC